MKALKPFLMATLMASAFSLGAVELIGHRGASYDAPENTVGALKLAYAQQADGGECDVYLTADGKIMVMHDGTTTRTTGVSNKISTATSTELRKLDAGKWGKFKDKNFSEPVPFLLEVLATVPKGKKMFVEVKCGPEIVPELKKQFASSGLKKEQLVVISFNYDVIVEVKKAMPQYQAYWLVGTGAKGKPDPTLDEMISKAKAAKADGLDLAYGFPIDKEFVRKVKAAGLKLYTWTVDDPLVAQRQVEAGVDGITTNRPQWLREQLRLAAKH